MPATLKQIADKLGVSVNTVSAILNKGRGSLYRPDTRQAVLNAARELNYRPNASARATRTGKFGGVAMLQSVDPSRSALMPGCLDAVQQVLGQRHLHLTFAAFDDQELVRGERLPQILSEWSSDGLLVNYNKQVPPRLEDIVRDGGLPAVWINARMKADCVHPDDLAAGRLAAEYLLKLGHRNIGFANYWIGAKDHLEDLHYSVRDRYAGYAAAMREAGCEPRWVWEEKPPRAEDRVAFTRRWLQAQHRPTAVIAYHPYTALPILHALITSGLHVPADLSVVVFHHAVVPEFDLRPTTVVLPEREVSRLAVEMLLDRVDGRAAAQPPRAVPMRLEAGDTTGKAAGSP